MTTDRRFWTDLCKRVYRSASGLDETRWRYAVALLVQALARHHRITYNVDRYLVGTEDEPSLRELLLWTHLTMKGAPAEFLQMFKMFREDELEWADREVVLASFELGEPPEDNTVILLALGGALRALDGFLNLVDLAEAPAVDELGVPARRWEMPSYGVYLVPADRDHRIGVNKPFIKRGLRYHSILPTKIGNNSVTLHRHADLPIEGPGARMPMRYGAALFPNLELGLWEDDRSFLVDRIVCDDQAGLIAAHLDEAHAAECDILLWPELTLDWTMIEEIEARLRTGARRRTHGLKIALAGSAHVPDAAVKGHRNRTRILDGRGEKLVDYDKRMVFSFPSRFLEDGSPDPAAPRLVEAIVPGKDLPVLMLEDRLVAIAICLDFCEKSGGLLPYHYLDVDLVLVPSMGFLNTTEQHLEQAHTMDVEYATEVFVVQQTPVRTGTGGRPARQPAGYSLLSASHFRGDHSQNEAFRVYQRQKYALATQEKAGH